MSGLPSKCPVALAVNRRLDKHWLVALCPGLISALTKKHVETIGPETRHKRKQQSHFLSPTFCWIWGVFFSDFPAYFALETPSAQKLPTCHVMESSVLENLGMEN